MRRHWLSRGAETLPAHSLQQRLDRFVVREYNLKSFLRLRNDERHGSSQVKENDHPGLRARKVTRATRNLEVKLLVSLLPQRVHDYGRPCRTISGEEHMRRLTPRLAE